MIRPVEKIDGLVPIKTAFISVSDKTDLDELVMALIKNCSDVKIISTGGTYDAIKEIFSPDLTAAHLMEVSEYTKQPATEGGLVKSLHHKLFLGYLTETYCDPHQLDLIRENSRPIDLVVINLYPFGKVVSEGQNFEAARGNIDVGGPSALQAAAKNCLRVMTVAGTTYYQQFISRLSFWRGQTSFQDRFTAARETFKVLGEYDTAIGEYFEETSFESVEKCYQIMAKQNH